MAYANVPVLMLSAVDTSTQTGSAVFCGQFFAGSFTSTFQDSSATGTIKVQASNEPAPRGNLGSYSPSAASWNDIPNATSTITSGVGPAIVLPTLNYQYIRVVFTYSSGGSSTFVVNGNFFST